MIDPPLDPTSRVHTVSFYLNLMVEGDFYVVNPRQLSDMNIRLRYHEPFHPPFPDDFSSGNIYIVHHSFNFTLDLNNYKVIEPREFNEKKINIAGTPPKYLEPGITKPAVSASDALALLNNLEPLLQSLPVLDSTCDPRTSTQDSNASLSNALGNGDSHFESLNEPLTPSKESSGETVDIFGAPLSGGNDDEDVSWNGWDLNYLEPGATFAIDVPQPPVDSMQLPRTPTPLREMSEIYDPETTVGMNSAGGSGNGNDESSIAKSLQEVLSPNTPSKIKKICPTIAQIIQKASSKETLDHCDVVVKQAVKSIVVSGDSRRPLSYSDRMLVENATIACKVPVQVVSPQPAITVVTPSTGAPSAASSVLSRILKFGTNTTAAPSSLQKGSTSSGVSPSPFASRRWQSSLEAEGEAVIIENIPCYKTKIISGGVLKDAIKVRESYYMKPVDKYIGSQLNFKFVRRHCTSATYYRYEILISDRNVIVDDHYEFSDELKPPRFYLKSEMFDSKKMDIDLDVYSYLCRRNKEYQQMSDEEKEKFVVTRIGPYKGNNPLASSRHYVLKEISMVDCKNIYATFPKIDWYYCSDGTRCDVLFFNPNHYHEMETGMALMNDMFKSSDAPEESKSAKKSTPRTVGKSLVAKSSKKYVSSDEAESSEDSESEEDWRIVAQKSELNKKEKKKQLRKLYFARGKGNADKQCSKSVSSSSVKRKKDNSSDVDLDNLDDLLSFCTREYSSSDEESKLSKPPKKIRKGDKSSK